VLAAVHVCTELCLACIPRGTRKTTFLHELRACLQVGTCGVMHKILVIMRSGIDKKPMRIFKSCYYMVFVFINQTGQNSRTDNRGSSAIDGFKRVTLYVMLRSYAYFMKPKLNPVSVYFFEPKVQFSSIVNCKRELG